MHPSLIGAEVSHDVLAAIIGGLSLIVVATIPMLWRQVNRARDNRVDLIALREQLAELTRLLTDAQERRRAEHDEIRRMLDRERWKGDR